ncbi:uncharacterized protein PpBr36_11508, partial [Pyricularia pennisetigena]|uniref:uncharacterized protein n=1 Tax=Pyricularia pennisetigena TaxID=1578925 RepID=UPI0011518FF5
AIPACRKCADLGQECLGYGNLFRWVGAVASRGKRAGHKTWEDNPAVVNHSLSSRPNGILPSTCWLPQYRSPHHGPPQNGANLPALQSNGWPAHLYARPSQLQSTHASPIPWEPPALTPSMALTSPVALGSPDDVMSSPSSTTSAETPSSDDNVNFEFFNSLTLHRLLDPTVQDYNSSTRYYLNYFSERVAADLVVYDIPTQNPFRGAVQICRPHGSLLHVIVALSAVHRASFFRSRGLPTQRCLYDALLAKQAALTQIKKGVASLQNNKDSSDVLTAVVFLINFGLIDSGRDSWKVHIVAAGRLMKMLQQSSTVAEDSSILALRDYVMSDCLTYFILGSTVNSWDGTGAEEVYGSLDIDSILERAETNAYHSIPRKILAIILRSTQLAAQIQQNGGIVSRQQLDEAKALTRLLNTFDIRGWATRISTASGGAADNPESREHMASAHRAAACAYLSMAVPGSLHGEENFAADIYTHLQLVTEADMLFKGSVWPTFILGAHTADREIRAWVERRLQSFWLSACPWGYVKTALEILQALWLFQEGLDPAPSMGWASPPESGRSRRSKNWLSQLRMLDVEYLVV